MKRYFWAVTLGVLVSLLLAGCQGQKAAEKKGAPSGPASQQPVAEEKVKEASKFPEKPITFVVPAPPGGAMDTYARAILPVMERYLPNKAPIVVKNVPGAETTLGSTEVFRAKGDGYTFGNHQIPGLIVNQILGKANYRLEEFTWLGRMQNDVYVTAVPKNSPYKSLADLKKAGKVNLGVVGLSSSSGLTLMLVAASTKIDMNIISFDGQGVASMAALRGDVAGVHFPYSTLRSLIKDGTLRPLVIYSKARLKDEPDTPTIGEEGYPELAEVVQSHVMVAGPPGMDPEATRVLRTALAKAMDDPEAKDWAEKAKRPLAPLDGEKAGGFIKEMIMTYSNYKEIFSQYVK